jgi:altronate hydrolase
LLPLLLSVGCESLDKYRLAEIVERSGRPVQTLTIQNHGGTLKTIEAGGN